MAFSDIIFFPLISGFMVAGFLVAIAFFAFWIWMIVDTAKRKFRNDLEKLIWLLVIIFASWIGAIVYFIVVRTMNSRGVARK